MPESMKRKLDKLVAALTAYQEGPKEETGASTTPAPNVPPTGGRYEPTPTPPRS